MMEGDFFNSGYTAEEIYSSYVGKEVVVFFADIRGTSRHLFGRITGICGDVIHMENKERGWRGSINCVICKVANVSTCEGWKRKIETNDEKI